MLMTEHNATQMMEETADLPEHPWPYLGELFKLEERKKDSFYFKCLLCLPKNNIISSFKNLPSNLKKHVEVSDFYSGRFDDYQPNYFKINLHCLHWVFS